MKLGEVIVLGTYIRDLDFVATLPYFTYCVNYRENNLILNPFRVDSIFADYVDLQFFYDTLYFIWKEMCYICYLLLYIKQGWSVWLRRAEHASLLSISNWPFELDTSGGSYWSLNTLCLIVNLK